MTRGGEDHMSTTDLITEARTRYMSSPRSRMDWLHYLQTVEALRSAGRQEAKS
jgi:hypothetical protein